MGFRVFYENVYLKVNRVKYYMYEINNKNVHTNVCHDLN